MSNHRPGIGSSRYRQFRLTATHETSGRFSVSVYGKALNKEWHEQQCLARFATDVHPDPLNSTEDVLAAIMAIIETTMLPRAVAEEGR
jgi:hypothetical protein